MKITIPAIIGVSLMLLYVNIVQAQEDSIILRPQIYSEDSPAFLDLGRVAINKEFAQTVTIKGSDLEKMPFANLDEAITAWLMGFLIYRDNLVYIIDGVLINDPNNWSIYDISEITLVQNALVQVNGAARNKQLLLIKTRKETDRKTGFTFAAQTALVKRNQADTMLRVNKDQTSSYYHQLHSSFYTNSKRTSLRLSANYIKDVNAIDAPQKTVIVQQPAHGQWRFNGSFMAKLGSINHLRLSVNYVPRTYKIRYDRESVSFATEVDQHADEKLFQPTLQLTTNFSSRLKNHIMFGYLHAKGASTATQQTNDYFGNPYHQYSGYNNMQRQFVAREHLSYSAEFNEWTFTPAIDYMYRNSKTANDLQQNTVYLGQVLEQIFLESTSQTKQHLLTPSLDIAFRNVFDIQSGIQWDLSENTGMNIRRWRPFVSTSVDILEALDKGQASQLNLSFSWTEGGETEDPLYRQPDYRFQSVTYNFPPLYSSVMVNQIPVKPVYSNWQAGAVFKVANDALTINYMYDDRRYVEHMVLLTLTPTGTEHLRIWPDTKNKIHRLGVQSRIGQFAHFKWTSGVQLSYRKQERVLTQTAPVFPILFAEQTTWTGGWVNRFQLKGLSAGIDLIHIYTPYQNGFPEQGKRWFQHACIGYDINMGKQNSLEFYLDMRHDVTNRFLLADNNYRRFYAAGIKAML